MLKVEQAAAIKKESIKLAKAKKRQEAREIKQLQERCMYLKAQEHRAKQKVDKVAAQKWAQVRQQKDEVIKQEIVKIGE